MQIAEQVEGRRGWGWEWKWEKEIRRGWKWEKKIRREWERERVPVPTPSFVFLFQFLFLLFLFFYYGEDSNFFTVPTVCISIPAIVLIRIKIEYNKNIQIGWNVNGLEQ